ncbi:MAG: 6-phosphofructokinase [Bacteroidaceae bacterium]|nr:6-phosphofructokinase [Bacteroidaceae bacterium]
MNKNVIVGQSGGPTCVINSSLAGVYKASRDLGSGKVYGMLHGIKGLMNDEYVDLDTKFMSNIDIDLLKRTPASFLGSCRYKLPEIGTDDEVYEKIFAKLNELEIGYFFYIGGNDSMDTIKKLSDYAVINKSEIKFVGVPKTIDNDLANTDHTPGFGSAAKYIATTLKELVCDCRIYDCPAVTIVEIMGRNAGWLTASAALVRGEDCEGVDMIFLPEKVFDVDYFMKRVKDVVESKKYCVVALSEGVRLADGRFVCELSSEDAAVDAFGHKMMSGCAKYLETLVKNKMGIKARAIEISTLQRCASHFASLTDIEEAFDCGATAVRAAICDGETGKVVCMNRVSEVPYKIVYDVEDVHSIANVEKTVPLEWITEDYVTDDAVHYIRPLIQGELNPIINDGLPRQIKL